MKLRWLVASMDGMSFVDGIMTLVSYAGLWGWYDDLSVSISTFGILDVEWVGALRLMGGIVGVLELGKRTLATTDPTMVRL